MEYFRKQYKLSLIASSLILVLLLGIVDYETVPDLSLSIFYLFAVCLVTWFTDRWSGVFISVAGAVILLIADLVPEHPYSHPVIPYWNMFVRLASFLAVVYILSEFKASLERERRLARTDSLTEVANRRFFSELANNEIIRARRYKHPFTIAYIDIDNFKAFNDRLGHTKGDELLHSMAETIRSTVREIDIVARLGGDEFIVLLPETEPESAKVAIGRVQRNLLNVMQENGWLTTFSIGVATFMSPPSTLEEMINVVDNLMYSVKNNGKDKIEYGIFDESLELAQEL